MRTGCPAGLCTGGFVNTGNEFRTCLMPGTKRKTAMCLPKPLVGQGATVQGPASNPSRIVRSNSPLSPYSPILITRRRPNMISDHVPRLQDRRRFEEKDDIEYSMLVA